MILVPFLDIHAAFLYPLGSVMRGTITRSAITRGNIGADVDKLDPLEKS